MERSSGFRQRRGSAGLVLMRGDSWRIPPDTNSAMGSQNFQTGGVFVCAQILSC